ncbi:hypothetical protein J2S43_000896 [Catenuloplanes nepalensis]|uniref:Uncharacterized protein n=1 Tax=Catenuloplanes nepalensis TaxID=587533 RepID=A0ABT9MLS5_9ACTN|nr:hypothetical protein [Catenuloplanes nepalensis]
MDGPATGSRLVPLRVFAIAREIGSAITVTALTVA